MSDEFDIVQFKDVCENVEKILNHCRRSTYFKTLSGDVKSLHIVLEAIETFWSELLRDGQDLDPENKEDLEHECNRCNKLFVDINQSFTQHSFSRKPPQHKTNFGGVVPGTASEREQSRVKDIGNLRDRLINRTQKLASFNAIISAPSDAYTQAKILEALNKVNFEYQAGRRLTPAFSQATAHNVDDAATWDEVAHVLTSEGNDSATVHAHRNFISKWMDEVFNAEEDSYTRGSVYDPRGTPRRMDSQSTLSTTTILRSDTTSEYFSERSYFSSPSVVDTEISDITAPLSSLSTALSQSHISPRYEPKADPPALPPKIQETKLVPIPTLPVAGTVDPVDDPVITALIHNIAHLEFGGQTLEFANRLYDRLSLADPTWLSISQQKFKDNLSCLVVLARREFRTWEFGIASDKIISFFSIEKVDKKDFINLFTGVTPWIRPLFSDEKNKEEGFKNFVTSISKEACSTTEITGVYSTWYRNLTPLPWGWEANGGFVGFYRFKYGLAAYLSGSDEERTRPHLEMRSFTWIATMVRNCCIPALRNAGVLYAGLFDFDRKLFINFLPVIQQLELAVHKFMIFMTVRQVEGREDLTCPLDDLRTILRLLPHYDGEDIGAHSSAFPGLVSPEEWQLWGALEELLGYAWACISKLVGFMVKGGLLRNNLEIPAKLSAVSWNSTYPYLWTENDAFNMSFDHGFVKQCEFWLQTHAPRQWDVVANIRRAIRFRNYLMADQLLIGGVEWNGIRIGGVEAHGKSMQVSARTFKRIPTTHWQRYGLAEMKPTKAASSNDFSFPASSFHDVAPEHLAVVEVTWRTGLIGTKVVLSYQDNFGNLTKKLKSQVIDFSHPWQAMIEVPFQKAMLSGDHPIASQPPPVHMLISSTSLPDLAKPVSSTDTLLPSNNHPNPPIDRLNIDPRLAKVISNSKAAKYLESYSRRNEFNTKHRTDGSILGSGLQINSWEAQVWKLLPMLEYFIGMNEDEAKVFWYQVGVQ